MQRSPVILFCDDDEDERVLIRDAFEEASVEAELRFASDGKELVEYLEKTEESRENARPAMILLDLNMPRMSGVEALEWIKSNPQYRAIPVVMYTISRDQREVMRCYLKGANAFMNKCSSFEQLVENVEAFAKYWMRIAVLPGVVDEF